MNQLEKARNTINECDKQIAECFEKRMQAVEEVVAYKIDNQIPVLDASREKEVIEKNQAYINKKGYLPFYKDFMNQMMRISKEYQHAIINSNVYGYQGSEGAFAQIALNRLFPMGKQKNYATWENVVQAVINHEVEKGVLPFENSYTGEVGEVLDLLFKYDVFVEAVLDVKVEQNLLVVKGTKMSDIKQVYSHHQAIAQCSEYFKAFDFEMVPYANTALAAKYVSECRDRSKVAIASMETAKIYDLEVLAENINTSKDNTTRFIVIGNQLQTRGNHVSLVFTVNHESGQLAKVMQIFAKYDMNMENIRSRSLKESSWQYYFYVEIFGNYEDRRMQEMLSECEQYCENLKIIGGSTY